VSNGYVKRGRKPGRRTDFMNDQAVIARREKALARVAAAAADKAPILTGIDRAASGRGNDRLDDILTFLAENDQPGAALPR
jgi:hypothetical protein